MVTLITVYRVAGYRVGKLWDKWIPFILEGNRI